jgi:pimeloyl-ACP methyl ester carboxylesterase
LSAKSAWQLWFPVTLAFIAASAPQGRSFAQADLSEPTFVDTPCSLPNVTPEILPRLRCGTVAVPRDHDNPAAGHFNLAVVVAKSAEQPSLPDPVVYISGGPGGPLTINADYQARHPYAPSRDLILVDQRGTGRSAPQLCPELTERMLEADFAAVADMTEDRIARSRAMYLACRDAAIGRGIDLNNFGTTVTAEDFDWVRRALGVTQWNVYGESYGTTVAMTLTAGHPSTVRTLVLDSVYPPDPVPPCLTVQDAARESFFRACAVDAAGCAASFPNLATIYAETLDRLRAKPLPVDLPPQLKQPGNRVMLIVALFEAVVGKLLYYPRYYPNLPRLIAAVHDGDTNGLGSIMAAMVMEMAAIDIADQIAVECRDRPHLRMPLAGDAGSFDIIHASGICAEWSNLGPPPVVPVGTTVPTLVLAGQFDPVAGVALSRQVADEIGAHALWVEFPRLGNNVRFFSPCATGIASRFIERPEATPDTSCRLRRPPIAFLPKSEKH